MCLVAQEWNDKFFAECNSFCKKWAAALVKNGKGDPVHIREVLENYKLKVSSLSKRWKKHEFSLDKVWKEST